MQKSLLKTIVSKQQTEKDTLLSLPYIERTRAEQGKKLVASTLIKVVLGPRRAGKSVFSLMLLKDHPFGYFNFDDPALVGEKLDLYELMDELHSVYGETKYFLFVITVKKPMVMIVVKIGSLFQSNISPEKNCLMTS